MTKIMYVATTNGQCGGYGDPDKSDMELCVLEVTPELIARLKEIERRAIEFKKANMGITEITYGHDFGAQWYEYDAVERVEAHEEGDGFQDSGFAFVPDGLFEGLEECRTEIGALEVYPTKRDWSDEDSWFCEFTLNTYRKHCGAKVTAWPFSIAELVDALSMEGIIA
jgi:hypothetical protein